MRPFAKPIALALLTGAAISAALPAAAQHRVYGPYYRAYPRYYGPRFYGGPIYSPPYRVYGAPPVIYPAPYAVYPAPYPVYAPYPVPAAPRPAAPADDVHPAAARPATLRNFIVYFPLDGDALTAEAQRVVHQAVDYARSQPGAQVAVVGYTDAAGTEGYNQDLSRRRSEAVLQALVANGIDPAAVQLAWRGEHEQAVRTANGVREQANRRVTIEVSGETTAAAQTRVPNPARQRSRAY